MVEIVEGNDDEMPPSLGEFGSKAAASVVGCGDWFAGDAGALPVVVQLFAAAPSLPPSETTMEDSTCASASTLSRCAVGCREGGGDSGGGDGEAGTSVEKNGACPLAPPMPTGDDSADDGTVGIKTDMPPPPLLDDPSAIECRFGFISA